jgi:hypothetical protein
MLREVYMSSFLLPESLVLKGRAMFNPSLFQHFDGNL